MAEPFTCDVKGAYRSACADLSEYEDTGYCVLHYPGDRDPARFRQTISDKLQAGDFNFSGVRFPYDVGAEFGYAFYFSFRDTQTPVDFHGATFEKDAKFGLLTAEFTAGATFEGTIFQGAADFSYFSVKGGATFDEAIFKGPTSFSGAQLEEATFEGATFEDDANFDYTMFETGVSDGGTGSAVGVLFKGPTSFQDTTFERRATFRGATFEGGADFSDATFNGDTDFTWTAFTDMTQFLGTNFEGATRFVETRFPKEAFQPEPTALVLFHNARISKPELFSFYRVRLRPSSLFEVSGLGKANLLEIKWYDNLEEKIRIVGEYTKLEHYAKSEQVIQASAHSLLAKVYRDLYKNAEEDRDYPTANEFHYRSMEALRKESWRRLGLIGTLYWALSGYGERPTRAFGVLVALWLKFTTFFVLVASSPFWIFSASGFGQLVNYIGQAAVYSLGAIARLSPEPRPDAPGLFQLLVIVEGILGPLQIALLALAVRRKVMR